MLGNRKQAPNNKQREKQYQTVTVFLTVREIRANAQLAINYQFCLVSKSHSTSRYERADVIIKITPKIQELIPTFYSC